MNARGSYTRVSVQLPHELGDWLAGRAQRSFHPESAPVRAVAELRHLQGLLQMELHRVPLTVAEACCLADVSGGPMVQPGFGAMLLGETMDAFSIARDTGGDTSSYGSKWAIDEEALVVKLQGIGPTADHALRDALAHWWATDGAPTARGFREAGLHILEEPGQ